MSFPKRTYLLISLTFLLTSSVASANAAPNAPGSACKKIGVKATSGSVAVTCTKVGSKLQWKKTIAPKPSPTKSVATPTPSASQSSKPTSAPSASASATPTPKVTPSQSQSASQAPVSSQDSYSINVRANSWFYTFTYSVDGSKTPLSSDASHSRVMLVPLGKAVILNLSNAAETSHGFWIPGLGVQKEIDPGGTTKADFTATKLGTFPGSCSVECGRGHAEMTFTVQVVSEADFLKYLSSL